MRSEKQVNSVVMEAAQVQRALQRMALEITEHTKDAQALALVAIRRGGLAMLDPIRAIIVQDLHRTVASGEVDIGFYRDDVATALPDAKVGPSKIDFVVEGTDIVLLDDVLHTGRTVRAAIDALLDYGRPRRIWLCVLCDRMGRQLPIQPDFVGKVIEISDEYVVKAEREANFLVVRAFPRLAQ